ncbi:AAA family ATPase [Litorilituus lipolyticus]|uniref:DNA-directed DNA polymerase n=1 Tax=Litorilituus lipolyticus TaxID=2491017 RepID=A0A502L0E4_9GAMM|nr:AAA family ATPase [Litorilituus lipolyticus]TPH13937.1 AAA family ATPase [Litorilituus lipolyticus]
MKNFTEKYKPKNLSEINFPDSESEEIVNHWISSKSSDPLLLLGPPATGKTSIADIAGAAMYADFYETDQLNLCGTDTINSIVSQIDKHLTTMSLNFGVKKLVVINEFYELKDKQSKFRTIIEKELYKKNCHFIFTANAVEKDIDSAVVSRCIVVKMSRPSPCVIATQLHEIACENEADYISKQDLENLASENHCDYRKTLQALERSLHNYS